MLSRLVYYFLPGMVIFVFCDGIVSVRSTRSQETNFWGVGRGHESINIFYRGNIDGSWKWIRGIEVFFVWSKTITDGNGREIKIWTNKTNWKGIVSAVTN